MLEKRSTRVVWMRRTSSRDPDNDVYILALQCRYTRKRYVRMRLPATKQVGVPATCADAAFDNGKSSAHRSPCDPKQSAFTCPQMERRFPGKSLDTAFSCMYLARERRTLKKVFTSTASYPRYRVRRSRWSTGHS